MKELLSPAGDMESLKAAIHAGCDAVYVGMKNFGARKFAHNFDRDEILAAISLCHLYGVRIYVTMNTLIKDHEVEEFLSLVDFLYQNGVDALIMQDIGMMHLVLSMYKDLEVHASTQFNNTNLDTIRFLKKIGVKRVVLSRELSLEEIKKIDVDIEKEVFIHGALCVSYSGNCLFSSMLGFRSGNRGECTGCCRLFYKLYDQNRFIKDGYLLSTKELNTSSHFQELIDSDILSFKIEGRMKSPEYVYFVTKFYRNLIDGKSCTKEDINILKILFNREFTTGNLFHDHIMNPKSPNHVGLKIGRVIEVSKNRIKIQLDRVLHQEDGIRFGNSKKGMIVNYLYNEKDLLVSEASSICFIKNQINLEECDTVYLTSSKHLANGILHYEERKIPIHFHFIGKVGEKVSLVVTDKVHSICVEGDLGECAISTPVTEKRIQDQLKKLGNTFYTLESIQVEVDSNFFIPIGKINALKRKALENLTNVRCSFKRRGKKEVSFEKLNIKKTEEDCVIVDTLEEYRDASSRYFRIYTKNLSLFRKYKDHKNIYYIEPKNCFSFSRQEKSLVSEVCFPKDYISDYSFNVTNIYSVYYLLKHGFSCVTLSVELGEEEILSLIQNFYQKFLFYPNVEVVYLDKIELMVICGNVLDILENHEYILQDFKMRKYPVVFDGVNTYVYQNTLKKLNRNIPCNRRYRYKYLK